MNHGTFFVDYFPLLKRIPAWFPGASFRHKANEWAPAVSELVNRPWENLKASVASGRAVSCYGTKNLEKFNLMSSIDANASPTSQVSNVKMEEVIKGSAAIAYFGEDY
ncbi:hypothetical protein VKT23_011060 [Stygiomarasmius scandens]|uniref:Uncharacterized protein n=1 Tax=Marasmiellus scandens TaxID=2682957 RepID=A0ABR1J9S3_9AGAR